MLMSSGWVPTQQRKYKRNRELEQPTGIAWYADEQRKNGSNESFKRTGNVTITDYSGGSATEANNSLQIPRKLAPGEW
jgi:hypothetical protein